MSFRIALLIRMAKRHARGGTALERKLIRALGGPIRHDGHVDAVTATCRLPR